MEPTISYIAVVTSEADPELVDQLAWAAGWRWLASSLTGSQKSYSVHQLEDVIAIGFEVSETARSFVWQCANNGIKPFGLIEMSRFLPP